MSNTWNGMTFTNIAQRGITTLRKALAPLQAFTTDFSTDVQAQGTVVTTRIVPSATAPTDLVDDDSSTYTSVVDDQTTTAVTVTLDPHPITGFALTDSEAQNIGDGVWADTSMRLVDAHVYAIANEILAASFDLVTNANYSTAAFVGSASTFDADDCADIRTTAVNAGWNMGDDSNTMVLQPNYWASLLKDNAIQDRGASGADALQSGDLPRLSGFKMIEAPTLPTASSTAASENLVGFIARPDAIAIAMRGVDTQDRSRFLHYEILQDDVTGAVMTYSVLWTEAKRRVEHIFEALYGVSKAQGASLKRITSA